MGSFGCLGRRTLKFSQSSIPSVLNIVSLYMHPSMLYKIKSALSNSSNRNKIEVTDINTNKKTTYD